jgi:hypothetical protein
MVVDCDVNEVVETGVESECAFDGRFSVCALEVGGVYTCVGWQMCGE